MITKAHMGRIHFGRPIEKRGAHVREHNNYSIGICLTGKDQFIQDQFDSAYMLVKHYMMIFDLHPLAIQGHYELDNKKTCPNFDMKNFRERLYE